MGRFDIPGWRDKNQLAVVLEAQHKGGGCSMFLGLLLMLGAMGTAFFAFQDEGASLEAATSVGTFTNLTILLSLAGVLFIVFYIWARWVRVPRFVKVLRRPERVVQIHVEEVGWVGNSWKNVVIRLQGGGVVKFTGDEQVAMSVAECAPHAKLGA